MLETALGDPMDCQPQFLRVRIGKLEDVAVAALKSVGPGPTLHLVIDKCRVFRRGAGIIFTAVPSCCGHAHRHLADPNGAVLVGISPPAWSGRNQHLQPFDVADHRHQRPFTACLVEPAQAHLAPAHHALDGAQHRLHGLLAQIRTAVGLPLCLAGGPSCPPGRWCRALAQPGQSAQILACGGICPSSPATA